MEIINPPIRALILAAGLGTRLRPFTDILPKCLMPIQGKPLLEIWLDNLKFISIQNVLVNLHYKAEEVKDFLSRPKFKDYVHSVYEEELLGTAGTLKKNYSFFVGNTTLLAHGDNLCICDFNAFLNYHFQERPKGTSITMMTFETDTPETCGIVELDSSGVVIGFHEKVANPLGNLANAAIYLIEPDVLEWLVSKKEISDFSTQVIPFFLGKIATWNNNGVMRDIGTPNSLREAQNDVKFPSIAMADDWQKKYESHPVHTLILNHA